MHLHRTGRIQGLQWPGRDGAAARIGRRGEEAMSVAPNNKSAESSVRGSLARRGGRLARLTLAFVTVVLLVMAVVGEKGLMALLKARRDFAALEQSLVRTRQENARLREDARRLREDPAAIEEQARRELGLIRPGEKLFIVRDAPLKK
jgi:cell division protein FtsB